jgi:hypothetical protein
MQGICKLSTPAPAPVHEPRPCVIDDLSQRQMVIQKQEEETPRERNMRHIRSHMVYNDWGLHGFVQMLTYKCLRFGKELHIIDEREQRSSDLSVSPVDSNHDIFITF